MVAAVALMLASGGHPPRSTGGGLRDVRRYGGHRELHVDGVHRRPSARTLFTLSVASPRTGCVLLDRAVLCALRRTSGGPERGRARAQSGRARDHDVHRDSASRAAFSPSRFWRRSRSIRGAWRRVLTSAWNPHVIVFAMMALIVAAADTIAGVGVNTAGGGRPCEPRRSDTRGAVAVSARDRPGVGDRSGRWQLAQETRDSRDQPFAPRDRCRVGRALGASDRRSSSPAIPATSVSFGHSLFRNRIMVSDSPPRFTRGATC